MPPRLVIETNHAAIGIDQQGSPAHALERIEHSLSPCHVYSFFIIHGRHAPCRCSPISRNHSVWTKVIIWLPFLDEINHNLVIGEHAILLSDQRQDLISRETHMPPAIAGAVSSSSVDDTRPKHCKSFGSFQ